MLVKAQAEVVVNRPPAEVFARLTDFDEWPQWGGQLASMEPTTPAPPQVGSRLRQVIRRGGKATVTDVEITELVENEALGIRSRDLACHFRLEPVGDATRLRSAVDVEAQGIWALVYRLLVKQFLAGDLRSFKHLVERV